MIIQYCIRSVSVLPLNDILQKHLNSKTIDFLKIDVEGWEHEVLKSVDLRSYRPVVVLIEATVPQERTASFQKWESLILGASYSFVHFDGVNRFYLANEHADLKIDFNSDRQKRHEQVKELNSLLDRATRDSTDRLSRIEELHGNLEEANSDRAARLSQVAQLNAVLAEASNDRDARLAQIEQLNSLLAEANTDRAARLTQIEQLGGLLTEAHNDRTARLSQIEQLGALLSEASTERNERLIQLQNRFDNAYRAFDAQATRIEQLVLLREKADQQLDERSARILASERQLQETTAALDRILQSRFWQITHPKLVPESLDQQHGCIIGPPTQYHRR